MGGLNLEAGIGFAVDFAGAGMGLGAGGLVMGGFVVFGASAAGASVGEISGFVEGGGDGDDAGGDGIGEGGDGDFACVGVGFVATGVLSLLLVFSGFDFDVFDLGS